MRSWTRIICCLFLVTGCNRSDHIPANIIPQKKMQSVLWDMMRADQFLSDFVLNKDSTLNKRIESIKLYQQIFAIHHINKEQFQKSFSFYKDHPGLFKIIMDSLSQPAIAQPTEIMRPVIRKDLQAPNKIPVTDTIPLRRKQLVN